MGTGSVQTDRKVQEDTMSDHRVTIHPQRGAEAERTPAALGPTVGAAVAILGGMVGLEAGRRSR